MGHRGRERVVTCEKCGRSVRRDKAVFIEKAIFSNPLERKEVAVPEAYHRVITREVAYCPGCGKHLRIYEKKIKQVQRESERERERSRYGYRPREPPRYGEGSRRDASQGESSSSNSSSSSEQGSQTSSSASTQSEQSKQSESTSESKTEAQ